MAWCIIISVNSCQPGFWCYNFFLLSLWLYFTCIWSLVKFVQYFTIKHYIWKVLISYRLRPDIRHVTCFWHKSPGSKIRIASRSRAYNLEGHDTHKCPAKTMCGPELPPFTYCNLRCTHFTCFTTTTMHPAIVLLHPASCNSSEMINPTQMLQYPLYNT